MSPGKLPAEEDQKNNGQKLSAHGELGSAQYGFTLFFIYIFISESISSTCFVVYLKHHQTPDVVNKQWNMSSLSIENKFNYTVKS